MDACVQFVHFLRFAYWKQKGLQDTQMGIDEESCAACSSCALLGPKQVKRLLSYVINAGQLTPAPLSYPLFITLSGVAPTGHFLK